jgi:hypothetical protein
MIFEPQDRLVGLTVDRQQLIRAFLVRFDAIFTLNQDLLLERHYLNDNISLSHDIRRWSGWSIPGTRPLHPSQSNPARHGLGQRVPDLSAFNIEPSCQPYIKLHGSSDWMAGESAGRLFIMGGNKAIEIDQYPLLSWYHEKFQEYLFRPDCRLMVIGYSFGDQHINEAICNAAGKGGLRLFVIDPQGVDVLDKRDPRAAIRGPAPLKDRLDSIIIGASRRPITSTFGDDRVEHSKVMRFIAK